MSSDQLSCSGGCRSSISQYDKSDWFGCDGGLCQAVYCPGCYHSLVTDDAMCPECDKGAFPDTIEGKSALQEHRISHFKSLIDRAKEKR